VWLRGPIAGIPPMLQPVAHSLLQCRDEVRATIGALPPRLLWVRPGGAAAAGFHVRHAIGSLDRLFTYARGEQLSPAQLAVLADEECPDEPATIASELVSAFDDAVERALAQLRSTPESSLLHPREVGRARLPSTVLGLLFHAAEHTQRHVGQQVTTAKVVSE